MDRWCSVQRTCSRSHVGSVCTEYYYILSTYILKWGLAWLPVQDNNKNTVLAVEVLGATGALATGLRQHLGLLETAILPGHSGGRFRGPVH